MKHWRVLLTLAVVLVVTTSCLVTHYEPAPVAVTVPPPPSHPTPLAVAPPVEEGAAPIPPANPFTLISRESLFAYLEELTAIQPYSGWRNSATEGEAEALDYVAAQLDGFAYLHEVGLEVERQTFPVFLATELWETRLHVTVAGAEVEVPADGLRGPRDDVGQALRFDSDGTLNDDARNPAVVEGAVVLVESAAQIAELTPADVAGKIVFLNYATINRVLVGSIEDAVEIASDLLAKGPAGLVLVTQFSNLPGESHGFGVGDVHVLSWVEVEPAIPTLYVRIEDMGAAGIAAWGDLARIERARLTWDADAFSPGTSGNLIAHIPGADASHAVILGAHIDSPNSPGAMDDGSGSVALLETARVLNEARFQPPIDLYLAWFGSEELGLYGAAHFANTHQDLLDRTVAMLEIDCLTHPLRGIQADLELVTWSYGALGNFETPWPDYLAQVATQQGVEVYPENVPYPYSDNSTLTGYDVPNADLIYENAAAMDAVGGFHYAGQVHSPYDTVDLAREVGSVLEQMAHVTLAAAVQTGRDLPTLRVTPPHARRAVFVASHTEADHMTPASFTDIGMALAWAGFDVDLIPHGQPVTPADLAGADLVVALPVVDYPSPDGDPTMYDDAGWAPDEIDALEVYVTEGGFLIVTNSARRIKFALYDSNEDWEDMNALAERFGVVYQDDVFNLTRARINREHPLMYRLSTLFMTSHNGIPFTIVEGQELASTDEGIAAALVEVGDAGGRVLALADVGSIGSSGSLDNLVFWQNVIEYVTSP